MKTTTTTNTTTIAKNKPNLEMQVYLYNLALKRGLPFKVLPNGAIRIQYPRTNDNNLSCKLGEQLALAKRARVCYGIKDLNR